MTSIRDIAKLAGVSAATVSRVMNETAGVEDEKRQRVERAILETGYKPNEVARSLFKKSSKIIGVIIPNIENPFFNELAKAVEEESYQRGYRVTLCSSNNDLEKEKRNLNLLCRMNADGIILMTNLEKMEEEVEKCKIPVITIDRQIGEEGRITCIQSDNYKGGRLAVSHLLDCGCKKIVQLCGPLKFSSSRERQRGYLDVCRERNIAPCFVECKYDYEDGLKKAEKLIEKYPDVDGIIAANDMVAISIYKVLTKKGYHIPGDIQLIGYDNISLSRMMTPELTTISQSIGNMGRAAVEALLDSVEEGRVSQQVFDVELLVRDTTIKMKE